MINVDEALALVLAHARPLAAGKVALGDALGHVLAEDVTSDVDSPPHDKSMVDGYAVIAADLASGEADLEIVDEVLAGDVPHRGLAPGQATRVMTGAPVPEGCDAVVMVERTRHAAGRDGSLGRVAIRAADTSSGQNILPRAIVMRKGDVVLGRGARLRPSEIGLLAEVGRSEVLAIGRPRVAILSTGNEVVPASEVPGPGQIRNSNGPILVAAVKQRGGTAIDLGIARDDRQPLREKIGRGLKEADLVVLSGGVSAGVMDLVPSVLAELGVEPVFHKVRLKPGKPLWFGRLPGEPVDKLVFGLPGNPVSSLVCFELFVRPAIAQLAGQTWEGISAQLARLETPFRHRGERPTFHPSILRQEDGELRVRPLRWRGSADLRTLAEANALAHFAPGDREYEAGEMIGVVPLEQP